jgi:hypothetical protein
VNARGEPTSGAYEADTHTVFLPNNATRYQLFHEMTHARHRIAVGKEVYDGLDRAVKEQHVYDTIINNRSKFNDLEIGHAKWYIGKLK